MALNFTHTKGDTFNEVAFEVKKNGTAIDLTGATIRMQLRKQYEDVTPALSLTSASSAGITITNAASGLFKINAQIINIEVFNYVYDIQFTLSSGEVRTYVKGGFNVTPEVTR
jgi:hypothetical protein